MIRGLLVFFLIMLVYSAIRTVFRSAVKAYHADERRTQQIHGEEMVQDPQCRTYIIKSRAITRRINGKLVSFCSEDCAQKYEASTRT